jgi:hypothetical protein
MKGTPSRVSMWRDSVESIWAKTSAATATPAATPGSLAKMRALLVASSGTKCREVEDSGRERRVGHGDGAGAWVNAGRSVSLARKYVKQRERSAIEN